MREEIAELRARLDSSTAHVSQIPALREQFASLSSRVDYTQKAQYAGTPSYQPSVTNISSAYGAAATPSAASSQAASAAMGCW